jgi:hypothetical protein
MPVQYNYTHAATRLLADAMGLWARGSREVAVHLAGLSAECVLKSVLIGMGLVAAGLDGQIPGGPANRHLRVHIDKLFGEFQAQLKGRRGAVYAAMLPAALPPPFDGWLVDHRYVADAQLSSTELDRWMWAAVAVSKVLQEALLYSEAQ